MRDEDVPCCSSEFWVFLVVSILLILLAGISSGLCLGILSFSQVNLEVLIKSGKKSRDRKNAAKILPLVKNEHLVLCTLLMTKTLAMEAVPLFLDSIFPLWAAILISGAFVLAFSEIIPHAVCARYGISIAAKLSGLVRLLLFVLFPLSYPMSKLLDWMLGKEHIVLLGRSELKTLVDLHALEAGKGEELSLHETSIIGGALDLTEKTARDAMTPLTEIFSLDINSKLDMQTMGLIMSKGHSRIPIYSGNPKNIIGLTLVKNLLFCHPQDETPIKYLNIRRIPRVYENWLLYDVLNVFQKGHVHMAVVVHVKGNRNKPDRRRKSGRGSVFASDEQDYPSTSIDVFISDSSEEARNPSLKRVMEKDKNFKPKKNRGILHEELESFRNQTDEEIIGIITMEDVLEELLQEDIVDETDQYIDLYNKIRINLGAARRSSSCSLLSSHWRTPHHSSPSFLSHSSPSSLIVQPADIGLTPSSSNQHLV